MQVKKQMVVKIYSPVPRPRSSGLVSRYFDKKLFQETFVVVIFRGFRGVVGGFVDVFRGFGFFTGFLFSRAVGIFLPRLTGFHVIRPK